MNAQARETALAVMLLAAALGRAVGDPVVSWPSLPAPGAPRGGLFSAWRIDQRKVLSALRRVEHADPDRDLDELKRRAWDDPTDLAAASRVGLACWRKGLLGEAVAQFRHVLVLDPGYTRTRLSLAELLEQMGSSELALRELSEGVRLQPDSALLRRSLAGLYVRRGDRARATEALRAVVRLAPSDPRVYLELARVLLDSGGTDAAKSAAEEAARLLPNDPRPWLLVVQVHRARGDWAAAKATLQQLEKRHPESGAAEQIGLVHLRLREFAAAREQFQRALRLPMPQPTAMAGVVVAAAGTGDHAAALAMCRRLRQDGHVRLAALTLANLWLTRGDASAVRAVWSAAPEGMGGMRRAYEEFLEAIGDEPKACGELALQLNLAELCRRAGWPEAAAEAATVARGLVKGSRAVGEMLASALAAAGRGEEELTVREQLAREHFDDEVCVVQLARAYVARRQWAQAEDVARGFIKRYFDDLESRVTAAELAIRRGDYETAMADCRVVLARHPLDPRPFDLLLDALVRSANFAEGATVIHGRRGMNPMFVAGPYERAISAVAEHHLDEALVQARRGLRLAPLDPRLRLLRAALLERKGDLEGALREYRVAAWLLPWCQSNQLLVARVAARAGMVAVATEAYRAALSVGPATFSLQLELADALSQWRRHEEAVAHLKSLRPVSAAQRRAVEARLAEEFLAQGEPTRAREAALRVLAEDAAEPVARRVAVLACRALGDLSEALKIALSAPKKGTTGDGDRGLLLLLQQRYQEAEGELRPAADAAEQVARRVELLTLHGISCIGLGRMREAQASFERALGALPAAGGPQADLAVGLAAAGAEAKARDALAALAGGAQTKAAWVRAFLPRLATDHELAALVLTGRVAAANGWLQRAAELLGAALKRAPTEPLLLYESARAHTGARLLDKALAAAQELARVSPRAGEAQLLLADVLDARGEVGPALRAYGLALPLLDKEAVSQRLALAGRFAGAGRLDDAAEAYRSVLDVVPDNPAACQGLAELYASHRPDRLAEAEAIAARALKAWPNDASLHDTLGWVYSLNKNLAAARTELLSALALAPRQPLYLYHLGMVDFRLGHRERARRALQMALALDAALPEAETARATLNVLEGGAPPGPDAP